MIQGTPITRLGLYGGARQVYGDFDPKGAFTPAVDDTPSRGGIWGEEKPRKHVEPVDWRRKSAEQRREFLERIILGLNDAPEDIQAEAAEIVAPYAPKRPTETVQVAKRRIKDLSRSIEKVEKLAALYQQYIDEENDIAILLVASG